MKWLQQLGYCVHYFNLISCNRLGDFLTRDEVRKQPHSQSSSDTTVPMRPLMIRNSHWREFGSSKVSFWVTWRIMMPEMSQISSQTRGQLFFYVSQPTYPIQTFIFNQSRICFSKSPEQPGLAGPSLHQEVLPIPPKFQELLPGQLREREREG